MKTKKEFKYFSIFNHEKEQEYLQEQHRHGWKFLKVTGFGMYHFEECDPEQVVYQLDFYGDDTKQKDEYLRMFADCGWEYIQEYAGYTYFRKPVTDETVDESIFCEDSDRLAMLERVYKGRLLPMLVIFSACLVPQFVINVTSGRYFVSALFGSILLAYVILFGYCAIHYYRKKNGTK